MYIFNMYVCMYLQCHYFYQQCKLPKIKGIKYETRRKYAKAALYRTKQLTG